MKMSICSTIPTGDAEILGIIKDAVFAARKTMKKNIKCYLVGGYVRDLLSGVKPKDIDCVCSYLDDFIRVLEDLLVSMDIKYDKATYATFGTMLMKFLGKDIEFVMPRKESYRNYGSRNPTVSAGTFNDDAYRRDFTINAIYLSLNPENFCEPVDLTGKGLQDLVEKNLDTPIDPGITFDADPLRMLRAARFVVKGFDPTKRVILASRKTATRLSIIVPERIQEELKKGAASPIYFNVLERLGLIDALFPELTPLRGLKQAPKYHAFDAFTHTMKTIECLPERMRFAGLYHDTGKFKTNVDGTFHGHEDISLSLFKKRFNALKFPRDFMYYNEHVIQHHDAILQLSTDARSSDRAIRRFIVKHQGYVDDMFIFAKCDKRAHGVGVKEGIRLINEIEKRVKYILETTSVAQKLAITGNDIINALSIDEGRKGNAMIGQIKRDVKQKVDDGDLPNDKEMILKYIIATHGKAC